MYEPVQLEKVPKLLGLDRSSSELIKCNIKYPASARENGIGGVVILNVLVNEFGQVQSVDIKQSLTAECDQEAMKAYWCMSEYGYPPLKYDSAAVKFRIDHMISFRLQ